MVTVQQLVQQTGLHLTPQDWFRATWRDIEPLPRPDTFEPIGGVEVTLAHAYTAREIVQEAINRGSFPLAEHFGRAVLPYLLKDEREALKQIIMAEAARTPFYTKPRLPPMPIAYLLAAYLGVHSITETVVAGFQDFQFGRNAYRSVDVAARHLHTLVMGLGDPQKILFHMRRLNLPLPAPADIRVWLANTELSALDMAVQSILVEKRVKYSAELVNALGCAVAPETAPHMLTLMTGSRGGAVARAWLDEHPQEAIAGLLPLAEGRGKVAELAQSYLRGRIRAGDTDLILQNAGENLRARLLGKTHAADRKTFEDSTTPDWLRQAGITLRKFSQSEVDRALDLETLPPLLIGEIALNDQQVETVLLALRLAESKNAKAKAESLAFLKTLAVNAVPTSVDAFTWALVEGWINAGTPPRERWLLNSLGQLGSDQVVSRFFPLIREWAAQKKSKLVGTGLECLAMIGSDMALMQLFRLEKLLSTRAQRLAVRRQIQAVLTARGLSEEQLGDRIVPDCGLDANGSAVFDYGARRFSFIMDHELVPMVREVSATPGKPRADLPTPTQKDDAEKAEHARNQWKLIKKQIRETTSVQSGRLERAMVEQRQWTWDEFETFFLRHPFMRHFAQMLVWGCYAPDLTTTFRLMADQTFTDAHDNAMTPDRSTKIGLVHPLLLPDRERGQWGELLHDYEIIPPFPQMGREIYRLTDEERSANVLTRLAARKAHILAYHNGLEKQGWTQSYYLHRVFRDANITVSIDVGQNDASVELQQVRFYRGQLDTYIARDTPTLTLGEVPLIIVSEIIRDLSLVFKA